MVRISIIGIWIARQTLEGPQAQTASLDEFPQQGLDPGAILFRGVGPEEIEHLADVGGGFRQRFLEQDAGGLAAGFFPGAGDHAEVLRVAEARPGDQGVA